MKSVARGDWIDRKDNYLDKAYNDIITSSFTTLSPA